MATRSPKKEKSVDDLTKPINKSAFSISDDDCFGKDYDATTTACSGCADNEVCAILYSERLKDKAKEIQSEPYLDEADMGALSDDDLAAWCEQNTGSSSAELVEYIMQVCKITDQVSVIERIKRFKETNPLTIKAGVIQWN